MLTGLTLDSHSYPERLCDEIIYALDAIFLKQAHPSMSWEVPGSIRQPIEHVDTFFRSPIMAQLREDREDM